MVYALSIVVVVLFIAVIVFRNKIKALEKYDWGEWQAGKTQVVWSSPPRDHPSRRYLPVYRICRNTGEVQSKELEDITRDVWLANNKRPVEM